MLIREVRERSSYRSGVILPMSDAVLLAQSAKATLTEVAKHASALGAGLQNAAPGDKAGAPNNSVSYLLSISETLTGIVSELEKLK